MGRFRHEAIAIDPVSSIAYQTEDRDDGEGKFIGLSQMLKNNI